MIYGPIIIGALVLIVLVALFAQILMKPIKLIWKLLVNSGIGLLLLLAANFIGQYFNLSLPINIITVLMAGFLGVPGVLLLFVLKFILNFI
ncbi:MAG: pro-sigmaK processing inhibitor BofA family protein [Syntrophomonadaceae bacterium]|jgi:inhibitor of the pro-sigma K processing machinery|nr:pro-sigmaK processing inhibitor BofA family protein [Syntrophomonadaceae bacterium]